jgi:DNA-binding NtrC family response regulator
VRTCSLGQPFENSGTTVSLLDRIAAGTFSERVFYRLNIIHLSA